MSDVNNAQQDQKLPVVVPIHVPGDEPSEEEWAMIEINGQLLQPLESPSNGPVNGKENNSILLDSNLVELGSLRFEKEIPRLIVGGHELKGANEKLKQPFCVLEKDSNQNSPEGSSYRVKGVITRKLMFSNYPKTILTKA